LTQEKKGSTVLVAEVQVVKMPDELEVCALAHKLIEHFLTDLQERLRSHASAFNSLLSLIPAKLYYGEDVSVSISTIREIR